MQHYASPDLIHILQLILQSGFILQPLSRYFSYLHTATALVNRYDGSEPFPAYSKKYFAANKKIGSRDRKLISHLCYCFFRTAHTLPASDTESKLSAALFICSTQPNEMLNTLQADWNEKTHLPVEEKLKLIGVEDLENVPFFPWVKELSAAIDGRKLSASMLIQPPVYLRIRPGNRDVVYKKLSDSGIAFHTIGNDCVSVDTGTKLDALLSLNRDAVIQDFSSQRVAELLSKIPVSADPLQVWDCCAASGGKSILALDILQNIKLTVSDIRESILVNLRKRFAEAGISAYDAFDTDLSAKQPVIPSRIVWEQFDLVIADVPCTGSGTWSRNPEQLCFFDPSAIDKYALVQQQICKSVIDFIKPGGYLLYCTCSVFRAENEANIKWLQKKFHLQLVKMELLTGYDKGADNLFAALLQKSVV